MLFSSKMVEVEALVHDSVKYEVLKTMQRHGFMHITMHNIEGLENAAPSEEATKIVDLEFRVGKLMEILNIAKEKRKGMLASLIPEAPEKFPAKRREREEILEDAKKLLSLIEDEVLSLHTKWEHINAEIEKIKTQKKYVEMLGPLSFDLSYLGEGPYAYIVSGTVKNISPIAKLKSEGKVALWYITQGKKKNLTYIVVVATHMKDKRELESALRFSGFSEFELQGWKGKPSQVLKDMDKKIENLKDERKEILKKLKDLRAKYYGKLAVLKDELYNEKVKEEIHPKFGKTFYTTVIKGFIPKQEIEEAKKLIETAGKGLVHIKWKDAKGGDVPVKYNNPKAFRPFQAFVDMYSTPKYGYIDPTVIIAPLFIIYFGLTLGDAGYGLIMAVLGFVMWKILGKHDWTNRTLGSILFVSGLSAIVFGIVQGGFFGPLEESNPFYPYIHYTPLLDPMQDPITLLVISLMIGIFQISLGLALGAFHHLKDKNYAEFLQAEVSWLILFPAGGALIGHYFGWWVLDSLPLLISQIFTVIGLFLFLPGVVSKIVDRKASINGLFFFDITGMVGDWLSYSRLLALDLATSGLALTINILVGIIWSMTAGVSGMVCCLPVLIVGVTLALLWMRKKDPIKKGVALLLLVFGIVGVINIYAAIWLFVGIFLIVGHIGNALLQALGSFVHSLRLQYVEFFSKFYEGDGVKFSPFREVRKYSRLEVNE
jgi:V/A-type H+-transporting ATPase subunit I